MTQARLRRPSSQHSEHARLVLTDRVLGEPMDPMRCPGERPALHQHLDHALAHAQVSSLLGGDETELALRLRDGAGLVSNILS